MAAGGSNVSLTSRKRKSLLCAVCLDIFRDPKLLPCAHTFCHKCLEDLIQQHSGGQFPCPSCRKDIEVPTQGASDFQTNFYIHENELERARNDTVCSIHVSKQLTMFCVECDLLLCMDCKLDVHLHHKTQSLQEVKNHAEKQLSKDMVRLREMKEDIEKKAAVWRTNQEEFKSKKAAIESKIRRRHSLIVAEADKYLKEALDSLEEACSETENTLSTEVQTAQSNIEQLDHLQQKIDAVIQNGEPCKVVSLAKEVSTGCGSHENVKKMEMKPLQNVSRPVHCADIPADDSMFVSMKKFIGTGELKTYDYVDPEVHVKEETECGEHADSVVFCVCPGHNKKYVSFEPSYKDTDPCVKKILAEGKLLSVEQKKGPRSYRNRVADKSTSIQYLYKKYRQTYVKWSASERHRRLDTTMGKKEGDILIEEVVKEEPFTTEKETLFSIACGPHRAVDVDSTGQLYVVVEDPTDGGKRRQVKLFQRPKRQVIDTYLSPLTPCQPADVCFFTLGGEEVLLIADEMNDAIHVVKVKDERLTFSRFLAPGCSVLVQPTALNTDPRGRLWVGCRGGRLLTMEPVASDVDYEDDTEYDDYYYNDGDDYYYNDDDDYHYNDDDDDDDYNDQDGENYDLTSVGELQRWQTPYH